MSDDQKTRDELIEELNVLRRRLEQLEAENRGRQTGRDGESENTFKMVFDNAPDGMLLADVETKRFRMANDAICQKLGYTQQEIVKLSVADIHPTEDLPYVVAQFEKQARGDVMVVTDIPVKRKDGSVFYADISSSETKVSGRSHLMGIFRDVTQRRRTQEALQESERLYKSFLEHDLTGDFVSDPGGTLIDCNQVFLDIFGFKSLEQARSVNMESVYPTPAARRTMLDKIRQERVIVNYEHEARKITGEVIFLEQNTVGEFDDDNNLVLMRGSITDMTKRRKAEEELRQSEEKFRLAMETTNDALWDWNVTTNEVYRNPRHATMLGYEPDELTDSQDEWETRIHPDDRKWVLETLEEHLAGKTASWKGEYRLRAKSGDYVWVLGCGKVVERGSDGKPVRMIGTNIDITPRRRTQEALEQSEQRYRELFENMTSGVAVYEAVDGGADFTFRDINRAGLAIDQIKSKDVIGKRLTKVFPGVKEFGLLDVLQRVFTTGNAELFPAALYKDGRVSGWRDNRVYKLATGEVVAVYNDITEQEKAEEQLRASEEKYRFLFDSVPAGIGISDLEGNVLDGNRAMEHMTGYSLEELQSMNVRDTYAYPEDREKLMNALKERGEVRDWEYRLKAKDGRVRYFLMNADMVERDGDQVVLITTRDITAGKQAEQTLRDSEKKYRTLSANIPGMVYRGGPDWSVEFISNSESVCGYSPEQFYEKQVNWLDIVHPEDKEAFHDEGSRLARDGGSLVQEYRIVTKDGNVRWLEDRKTCSFAEDGTFLGIDGIVFDVTERKKALETIRESQELIQGILDHTGSVVVVRDKQGRYIMVNRRVEEFMGLEARDIIGKTPYDIHPAENADKIVANDRKVIEGRRLLHMEDQLEVRGRMRTFFGSKFPLLDASGEPYAICHVAADITDRKEAEEELRRSEETFRLAMEATNDAVWDWNTVTNEVYRNPRHATMLGYDPDELSASQSEWEERIHPDDKDLVFRATQEHIEGRSNAIEVEYRLRTKSGDYVWVLGRGKVVTRSNDGSPLRIIGTTIDITERRSAEQALRRSEEMLRSIIDHSVELFFIHDTEHNLTYVSPQSQEILGYTPKEMMVKWTSLTTDNPINDDGFRATERAIETGQRQAPYVLEVKRKDGELRTVEINESPVKDENGNVVAVTGGLRDVTERMQVERALQQSEEKYRMLITNVPDIIWTSDFRGNSTYISPNVEQVYGYTPQEICQQSHDLWLKRVHPDDLDRVECAYRALFETGARFDVEYRIQRKDGAWIWLHDRSIATYEKDGAMYADGIFSDVTDRKMAENELRQSRANLALAQQIARVGSWEWNIETGKVTWSDETYRLFGYEPGQVEPTFEFFLKSVHPEDRVFVKRATEKAASDGQQYHLEFRTIGLGGVERVLDCRAQVLRDGRGKPLRMLGVAQDITERRIAEQRNRLRFQILESLHQPGSLRDICAKTLSLIKEDMNCDAIALRMKQANDYPYLINDGFSSEFIESENRLLGHDRPADDAGNPGGDSVLGCMCGVVLGTGFDPTKPFFTDKGSFWTNNISELVATTTREDRCGASCTACSEHGYESVALVPIQSDGQVIGLLQIDAYRKNVFSPDRIQFLEELALLIRAALERKNAEQALRQSEEKFRRIAEQSFDVVFSADLDGTLTYASPSATRVFGYRPDEMVGRTADELTPESGASDVARQFQEIAEGRSFSGREMEVRRKDGTVATVELNAAPIRDGDKIIGALASARDITERRRVENALRESEEKYRTLVESAGESIASIDADGKFLFMNTTAAERLGGKPEDYVGKKMRDLFPKEIADRQMASVRRVIDTLEGINVIVPTVLQGQPRWYNTTIEPLTVGGADTANAVMMIARDIHDIKLAEEELARYREKMAHADRLASLGTLSATVAHELTQPLTVVRLTLDNLLDDLKAASSPESITSKVEESLGEISNITSIIDRFRSFARKSSAASVAEVNVEMVARRITRLLDLSARRARITLHVEDMHAYPPVRLNERDFEQLVFALVQNAVQAADGETPHELVISGIVKDRSIELRFADDCGGIAPEHLDAVLEPFFTTKPPGQGTGLGLCIVQQIASRAGGKVSVESQFGKGSTFVITLPVEGGRS